MTLRFAPSADKTSDSSGYLARGLSLFAIGLSVALIIGCDSGGSTGGMEEDPTPPEEPPPGNTNGAPTAVAEVVTVSPEVDSTVALSGSESDDPDGDDLTYNWTVTGPDDYSVEASGEQPTFTPPQAGDYTAALEVSDGDTTDSDEAALTAELVVQELEGPITEDRTLGQGEEYIIRDDPLLISSGATVTAEAGVTIYFDEDDGVKLDRGSEFVANGTESNSVSLVGAPGQREAGSWEKITVTDGSSVHLNHSTVRHSNDVVFIDPNGAEPGIEVEITNSTFEQNANRAIAVSSTTFYPTDFELVDVSGNSFRNVGSEAISIPFRKANGLDGSNVFAGGQDVELNLIEVGVGGDAGIDRSIMLNSLDGAKYRVGGRTEFNGDTLRVESGTDVVFEEDALLDVKGGSGNGPILLAEGTSSDPITFTAPETEANPEWWDGINVTLGANAVLRHVTVRHGGAGTTNEPGAILLFSRNGEGSTLVVENSTIADGAGDGIVCGDGEVPLQVNGNTFENIAGENIRGCN